MNEIEWNRAGIKYEYETDKRGNQILVTAIDFANIRSLFFGT